MPSDASRQIPDGFSSRDRAPVPTRAELARRAREVAAITAWYEKGNLSAVREATKASSNGMAQVILNRAIERYDAERTEQVGLIRTMMDHDIERALEVVRPLVADGRLPAVDRLVKILERRARLYGADLAREESGGPVHVLIDARPPWERSPGEPGYQVGEVIEGEAEEVVEGTRADEPPELEPGA